MNGADALQFCNESELLWLAKRQGLGRLKRGIPTNDLIAIVNGELDVGQHHLASTNGTRKTLELFINHKDNFPRIMSQLPGCDGQCTKYECSEGKHLLCFMPNEEVLHL